MNISSKILKYSSLILVFGMGAAAHASPTSVFDVEFREYSGPTKRGRDFSLAAETRSAATPTQRLIAIDKAVPTGLVLTAGAEASLWNFIACIHAQQRDRAFERFESDLRHIDHLPTPHPVSTVPLPGSAWLLLVGLMGMVGSRVMPRNDKRAVQVGAGQAVRHGWPFRLAWRFHATGRLSSMRAGSANLGLQVQSG